MWDWAITNVKRDYEDRGKLLSSFLDALVPLLRPDVKPPANEQHWPEAQQYAENLRRMGASEEFIDREMEAARREHDAMNVTADDEGDSLELIRAPDART